MTKYITDKGKKKLLRLGFLSNTGERGFNFLALGTDGSNASETGNKEDFIEPTGNGYKRVELVEESNTSTNDFDTQNASIMLSGIFEKENFNPSSNGYINEIGIVDKEYIDDQDTFFAFSSIPRIDKSHNVSLKYTIILEIKDAQDE